MSREQTLSKLGMALRAEAQALGECDLQHMKQLMGSGGGDQPFALKHLRNKTYPFRVQLLIPLQQAAKLPTKAALQDKNFRVKDNSHREPSKTCSFSSIAQQMP